MAGGVWSLGRGTAAERRDFHFYGGTPLNLLAVASLRAGGAGGR